LNKKISAPSENKKFATAQSDKTRSVKRSIDYGLQGQSTRTTGYNSTYKKLAVQWLNQALCFVSSFMVADSLVFQNRQLLVAAKRYSQW